MAVEPMHCCHCGHEHADPSRTMRVSWQAARHRRGVTSFVCADQVACETRSDARRAALAAQPVRKLADVFAENRARWAAKAARS